MEIQFGRKDKVISLRAISFLTLCDFIGIEFIGIVILPFFIFFSIYKFDENVKITSYISVYNFKRLYKRNDQMSFIS